MGGLRINTDAQVLGDAEAPIAGLYAAGEVAGHKMGTKPPGLLLDIPTSTFGHIAIERRGVHGVAPASLKIRALRRTYPSWPRPPSGRDRPDLPTIGRVSAHSGNLTFATFRPRLRNRDVSAPRHEQRVGRTHVQKRRHRRAAFEGV